MFKIRKTSSRQAENRIDNQEMIVYHSLHERYMNDLHKIVPRVQIPFLGQLLQDHPVVILHGARQTGKTTVAQTRAIGRDRSYLTLDDFNVMDLAQRDPAALFIGHDREEIYGVSRPSWRPIRMPRLEFWPVNVNRQPYSLQTYSRFPSSGCSYHKKPDLNGTGRRQDLFVRVAPERCHRKVFYYL